MSNEMWTPKCIPFFIYTHPKLFNTVEAAFRAKMFDQQPLVVLFVPSFDHVNYEALDALSEDYTYVYNGSELKRVARKTVRELVTV